jgi:hypothetical protein
VTRDEEDDADDVSERTPLVSSSRLRNKPGISSAFKIWNVLTSSPNIAAAALGLIIGLIKPVQRALIGVHNGSGHETGTWQSIGTGLILLGGAYATVEVLAVGASLRAAERKL